MKIRPITPADYAAVYQLIQTAFLTAAHRDGDEQDFAVRLRKGDNYIAELDLVAEQDGQLVGHIMFTRTVVDQPNGNRHDTLLVAPLAVLLEWRGSGVGAALMHAGLDRATELGYDSAFLIGDPNYYVRFGFEPVVKHGIGHAEMPLEYVQAKELRAGALAGVTGLVVM